MAGLHALKTLLNKNNLKKRAAVAGAQQAKQCASPAGSLALSARLACPPSMRLRRGGLDAIGRLPQAKCSLPALTPAAAVAAPLRLCLGPVRCSGTRTVAVCIQPQGAWWPRTDTLKQGRERHGCVQSCLSGTYWPTSQCGPDRQPTTSAARRQQPRRAPNLRSKV